MNESARDAAAVKIFPPIVPLVTLLFGVGLNAVWPIKFVFVIPKPYRYWLGGAIIVGIIVGLGLWSVVTMRSSGQSENPFKPTHAVVDYGPYRLTRNPMYLQMVIACVGFAILLMNWWILLLTPLCAWLLYKLAIAPEEAYLERKFGESYRDYKRRVRRWL